MIWHGIYMCSKNDQHNFIPFIFDNFSFLIQEAVNFLKRIQKVIYSNVVSPKIYECSFSNIRFYYTKRFK
jgi:hypothetical protein